MLNDFTTSGGTPNTLVIGTFGTQIGQAFMTGGTLLNLSNVVFPQVNQDTNGNNVDSFQSSETFGLYTSNLDGTANLVAPVYTFSLHDNTVAGTGFGDPNFSMITATAPTGLTNVTLATNTRYWLVLSYSSNVEWDYTSATNYANQLGVTIPSIGSSFSTDSDNGTVYGNLSDGPQLLSINATPFTAAVPEPSSFCLLGLAGVGALMMARRARSAKMA